MCHLVSIQLQTPHAVSVSSAPTDTQRKNSRRADAWLVKKSWWPETPRTIPSNPLTHTQPTDRWFTVTEQRPLSLQMPSRRTSNGNYDWLLARHNKSPELNTLQCGCRRPYRGQLLEVIMYWCTLLGLLSNNSQCIPCDRCMLTYPLRGFGVFLYLGNSCVFFM